MKRVHTMWGAASVALVLGGACDPLEIPLFPERSDLGVEQPPADPAPDAEAPPAVPVGPDAALCRPGAEGCLACVRAAACDAERLCHPVTGECTEPCDAQNSCDDGNRCNADLGVCVECVGDDTCSEGNLRRCDPGAGVCVECVTSADCTEEPQERPTCLTALGRLWLQQ